MAPRSLLSAGLAALIAALLALPASAQELRAAAVREVAPESEMSGTAPAVMPTGDGYLVAWRAAKFTMALRASMRSALPSVRCEPSRRPSGSGTPPSCACCRCPEAARRW